MSEVPHPEIPQPKEFITPQAIEGRVKFFLRDADLSTLPVNTPNRIGERTIVRNGAYKMTGAEHLSIGIQGYPVAEYDQALTEAGQQMVGGVEQYTLKGRYGQDQDELRLTLTKDEKGNSKITVLRPQSGMRGAKRGALEQFDAADQKAFADVFNFGEQK